MYDVRNIGMLGEYALQEGDFAKVEEFGYGGTEVGAVELNGRQLLLLLLFVGGGEFVKDSKETLSSYFKETQRLLVQLFVNGPIVFLGIFGWGDVGAFVLAGNAEIVHQQQFLGTVRAY